MAVAALDIQHRSQNPLRRQDTTLSDLNSWRRELLRRGELDTLCGALEQDIAAGRMVVAAEAFEKSDVHERAALVAYSETLAECLRAIGRATADQVATERRATVVSASRAVVPRVGLMLSGGGALGNYHYGVLRALLTAGLLPKVISGSSAGALIGAVAATRDDGALAAILRPEALAASRRRLDGSRLISKIAATIPDMTFAEAAKVSGRRLTISVTSTDDATALVLNAETTPHVLIRRAVLASCAVPYSFPPVELLERPPGGVARVYRPGSLWADGSLSADLPAAELKALYGVGLTITSLVNPLILPWIRDPHSENSVYDGVARLSARATKSYVYLMAEALAPLTSGDPNVDFLRRAMSNVAVQRYLGDINILPSQRWHDPRRLLDEADADQVREFMVEGERATGRRLDMLRACTSVNSALEELAE